MTQFGFPHAAILSLALILILYWISNRVLAGIKPRWLISFALVLAALYVIAKLGIWLSAPHH